MFLKNRAKLQNLHMTELFFDKFRGFLFKIEILRASRAYQAKPSLAKSSQARASNSQVKPRIFYRRSLTGYVSCYDYSEIYREGREDPKSCFKFAENWICTS